MLVVCGPLSVAGLMFYNGPLAMDNEQSNFYFDYLIYDDWRPHK